MTATILLERSYESLEMRCLKNIWSASQSYWCDASLEPTQNVWYENKKMFIHSLHTPIFRLNICILYEREIEHCWTQTLWKRHIKQENICYWEIVSCRLALQSIKEILSSNEKYHQWTVWNWIRLNGTWIVHLPRLLDVTKQVATFKRINPIYWSLSVEIERGAAHFRRAIGEIEESRVCWNCEKYNCGNQPYTSVDLHHYSSLQIQCSSDKCKMIQTIINSHWDWYLWLIFRAFF